MANINSYSINYDSCSDKKGKRSGGISVLKIIITVITVIVATFLLISIFSIIGFGENDQEYIRHQVETGESLWTIALMYYDEDIDIRKAVYHIKKLNNIESAIINPGNELLIPIK